MKMFLEHMFRNSELKSSIKNHPANVMEDLFIWNLVDLFFDILHKIPIKEELEIRKRMMSAIKFLVHKKLVMRSISADYENTRRKLQNELSRNFREEWNKPEWKYKKLKKRDKIFQPRPKPPIKIYIGIYLNTFNQNYAEILEYFKQVTEYTDLITISDIEDAIQVIGDREYQEQLFDKWNAITKL